MPTVTVTRCIVKAIARIKFVRLQKSKDIRLLCFELLLATQIKYSVALRVPGLDEDHQVYFLSHGAVLPKSPTLISNALLSFEIRQIRL